MNINYAIFRSEPIYTLNDLAQIGSHNKREKKAYNSNPDIRVELSKNNIELVPLTEKYVKGFYNLTKEYRKEHENRMKTERENRKKTFNQMLNQSQNVVADELIFTASNNFFENMTIEDIKEWANTSMEFVYNDLGYTKEQILHATVHLDEKTPHLHCVVVPLVKKYDKRTKTERFTISKKQYIKDKVHLSQLQDKYHVRLMAKGYDLSRGIKYSDNKHIAIKDYKKITQKLNNELNVCNTKLENEMIILKENLDQAKEIKFDKEFIKVKKETIDNIGKVVKESQKVLELQPKLQKVFTEVSNYTKSYEKIKKENHSITKELNSLKEKNKKLKEENRTLSEFITKMIHMIKSFFRRMLLLGNEKVKDETSTSVEALYFKEFFNNNDVIDVAKGTDREKEILQYVGIENENKEDFNNFENVENESKKEKDDFDISL